MFNFNTKKTIDTTNNMNEGTPAEKWVVQLLPISFITQAFLWGSSSPRIGIGFIDNSRIDRLLFVLIFVLFLRVMSQRKLQISKMKIINVLMLVFTVYASLSLFYSGANSDSSSGENRMLNALFNITVFPFLTYYITSRLRISSNQAIKMLVPLGILGVYLSFTSVMEHFDINALIWPHDINDPSRGIHWGRSRGPFLEAVAMGRVLNICFLIFSFFVTQTKGSIKAINWILVFVTAVAIYFVETRGPWVILGVSIITMMAFPTPLRKVAKVIIILMLIVAIFGVSKNFSFWDGTLFSKRQNTVVDREVSNIVTLKMFQAKPVFGVGFGMFNFVWYDYYDPIKNSDLTYFDGSHNTFLTMLAELGSVGLGTFILIYLLLGLALIKKFKQLAKGNTVQKMLITFAVSLMFSYLLSGFVSDLRWSLMQNNLFYFFYGLAVSVNYERENVEINSNAMKGNVVRL